MNANVGPHVSNRTIDASREDPLKALRRFAAPKPPEERCDLCGQELAPRHDHLMELARRRLLCACGPCALLFSGAEQPRFRKVPDRIESLTELRISDADWDALNLPINLAFFIKGSTTGDVVAMFPSPAGATEAHLSRDAWDHLEAENPVLRTFEPDVEALLVNRMGEEAEAFRVPIDRCFELVGLLRLHWKGFSGGSEVWDAIGAFFERLRADSVPPRGDAHA